MDLEIDEAFFRNLAGPAKPRLPGAAAPPCPRWRVTVQVFSSPFSSRNAQGHAEKRTEERWKVETGRRTLTWPTHAAGGIAALWLLAAVPGTVTAQDVGALAVLAAGAALLPDLDAQRSKIRSLALGPVRPFDPLGALVYGAWGHRGPLHSLPGLAVFGTDLPPCRWPWPGAGSTGRRCCSGTARTWRWTP